MPKSQFLHRNADQCRSAALCFDWCHVSVISITLTCQAVRPWPCPSTIDAGASTSSKNFLALFCEMDSRDSNFQTPADPSAFDRSSPSPSQHQSVRSGICRSSRSSPHTGALHYKFLHSFGGQRIADVVHKMPLVNMSRSVTVFVSVSVRHLAMQHSLHRLHCRNYAAESFSQNSPPRAVRLRNCRSRQIPHCRAQNSGQPCRRGMAG